MCPWVKGVRTHARRGCVCSLPGASAVEAYACVSYAPFTQPQLWLTPHRARRPVVHDTASLRDLVVRAMKSMPRCVVNGPGARATDIAKVVWPLLSGTQLKSKAEAVRRYCVLSEDTRRHHLDSELRLHYAVEQAHAPVQPPRCAGAAGEFGAPGDWAHLAPRGRQHPLYRFAFIPYV
jgi:hypothetical protein